MVFDQYGFEMAHRVFEGTRNDGESLVEMIAEMHAAVAPGKEKPLVVMDAGVASRKNLNLLRERGFGYLVNDTRGQRQHYLEAFREQQGFQIVQGREGKTPVRVRFMEDPQPADLDGDGPERGVLCKSEPRGEKERAIVSNAEHRFLNALGKLAARVENKRLQARPKIEQSIG